MKANATSDTNVICYADSGGPAMNKPGLFAHTASTAAAHAAVGRRSALLTLGALGVATALPSYATPSRPAPAADGAAFDVASAGKPWLAPLKGLDHGDLRCSALAVTGRWPAELRGRFYRNGPAVFERDGQRYHHWFDGDGMVQQFTFGGGAGPGGVSHLGRLVRTPKLVAEREADHFLYGAFGTAIHGEAPIQGPDSMNTANTNAIEHAGLVLAMWEGGSAFALDPKDLSTSGAVTWQPGFEAVPFSAHPKIDADGNLWNMGTFGDKIVVWHVGPDGRLVKAQVGASPYPNGMVHDMAMTERWIVLPLPPIKMHYDRIAAGATPAEAFIFERNEPLRVLVMSKDDIAQRRIFELPTRSVFHVGNAHERPDGRIALSFVGAPDADFLVHGAVALVAGRTPPKAGSKASLHTAVLDMATGKASVDDLRDNIEFPRIDPRRIGRAARHLVSAANWKPYAATQMGLFHGVQRRDLQTGKVERFDYGEHVLAEEHIVVPKPRSGNELDAWLIGTSFDTRRRVTSVNVLDARHVSDGPIARATLPYGLPYGFHGNFTAA